jgi:hypothetical protein
MCSFSPNCIRHELPTRVFERKGGCTGLELNFCRHNRPDPPPGHRRGRGGQSDAACGNGRLSPRQCSSLSRLSAWSALKRDPRLHVAAARDSSEAPAADSRFTEIFLASALPNQDSDAFPSCTVVIEQFDRLERHHEQAGRNHGTRAASSGF